MLNLTPRKPRCPPVPFNTEEFERLEIFLDGLTAGDPNKPVDRVPNPMQPRAWGISKVEADSNLKLCRALIEDINNVLQRSQRLDPGDHWHAMDEYIKTRFKIISLQVKIALNIAASNSVREVARLRKVDLPKHKTKMLEWMKDAVSPVPNWIGVKFPEMPIGICVPHGIRRELICLFFKFKTVHRGRLRFPIQFKAVVWDLC